MIINQTAGGENVTAEVTMQTPLIEQIEQLLVGKAAGSQGPDISVEGEVLVIEGAKVIDGILEV